MHHWQQRSSAGPSVHGYTTQCGYYLGVTEVGCSTIGNLIYAQVSICDVPNRIHDAEDLDLGAVSTSEASHSRGLSIPGDYN